MATLGRWTGGSATHPTESWASPNGLGTTQARNDSSAYSWSSSSARLTLPSSGLADGYLVIARLHYTTTHNNRHTHNARFTTNSGTGNFLSSTTGGYSRNSNNNENFVTTWAIVDNPSASYSLDYEWKRDTGDGTTAGSVTSFVLDVIPLYYSDIALYSSTSTSLLGGTTPNTLPLTTTVVEGTNITRSGNVISVTGDNKRYLIFGSNYTEGRGGRTQRWVGGEYDGTQDRGAMACIYHRDTGTDESGIAFSDIIETATATRTIEQFVYRGDGVANNEGGANIDGSTPSVGAHAMAVIELNDSCEVIRSSNASASAQSINTGEATNTDISAINTVDFNDSGSFTKVSATAVNAEQAMDALLGANIGGAYDTVSSATRFTCRSRFHVNGTEDNNTFHGNYGRGNQSSADTFGWSANPMAFVALSSGDDIGVSTNEIGDAGPVDVQPAWAGFWALNLDTMEDTGGATLTASGTPSIAEVTTSATAEKGPLTASGAVTMAAITAAGVASFAHDSSGTPTLDEITASGTASTTAAPLTASGTPSLDLVTASGTARFAHDSSGTPTVEVITASGTARFAHDSSGTPSADPPTASGSAIQTYRPSGSPSIETLTASGQVTLGALAATGTPSIDALTASGTGRFAHDSSGGPSIDAITANGVAHLAPKVWLNATQTLSGATEMTVTSWNTDGTSITFTDPVGAPTGSLFLGVEARNQGGGEAQTGWIAVTVSAAGATKTASGTPSIAGIEASGIARYAHDASGTPSVDLIAASGSAIQLYQVAGTPALQDVSVTASVTQTYLPSGSPEIAAITASGVATKGDIAATGTASLETITADGDVTYIHQSSGTPTLDPVTASGTVRTIVDASGAASIESPTASSAAILGPRVYLNTSETLVGATLMTVTSFSADGTSITFNDPLGAPTGPCFLGVENRQNDEVGWIAVTVASATSLTASGTPQLEAVTASGQAIIRVEADGTPVIETITASGSVLLQGLLDASGTPTLEEITASGTVSLQGLVTATGSATIAALEASGTAEQTYIVTGTPVLEALTASGVAFLQGEVTAFGNPSIPTITADGSVTQTYIVTGTPSVETLTASGTVTKGALTGSGTPSIETITASGVARFAHDSSGTPSIAALVASGEARFVRGAGGAATLAEITASATATLGPKLASGAITIGELTASGIAIQIYQPAGAATLEGLTASGIAGFRQQAIGTPVLADFVVDGIGNLNASTISRQVDVSATFDPAIPLSATFAPDGDLTGTFDPTTDMTGKHDPSEDLTGKHDPTHNLIGKGDTV